MEHHPRWVAVLGLLAVATLALPAAAEARKGREGQGPAASGKPKAPTSGQAQATAPPAGPHKARAVSGPPPKAPTSGQAQATAPAAGPHKARAASGPPPKAPTSHRVGGPARSTAKGSSPESEAELTPARSHANRSGRDHEAAHQRGVSADPPRSKSERRRDRKKRRLAAVRVLRERWGQKALMTPAVHAALKVHSWRMARLRRIKDLAQKKGETKIVARADALIDQEQERFLRHMEQLKASGSVAESHTPTPEGSATRARPPTGKSVSAGTQAASARAGKESSP